MTRSRSSTTKRALEQALIAATNFDDETATQIVACALDEPALESTRLAVMSSESRPLPRPRYRLLRNSYATSPNQQASSSFQIEFSGADDEDVFADAFMDLNLQRERTCEKSSNNNM